MNASLSDSHTLTYRDQPPVLVVGNSDAALAKAVPAIRASGLRVADTVMLRQAAARIDRQASASALWLELDRDCGGPMDELLDHVNREAGQGRYPAIVSATAELLDALAARLCDSAVELIIDADDAERAAALAVATSNAGRPDRLSDVAADQNAARLRQLSDEVSRIASTLARLSAGPATPARKPEAIATADLPEVSAEIVRSVIRARRLRSRFFPEELFADPAWDMLLDLFQAEIGQLRVPVSSLCIAAAVPATTALRWLRTMTERGLFVRSADPHDGRRVFVELAPQASAALRRYFAEVGTPVAA